MVARDSRSENGNFSPNSTSEHSVKNPFRKPKTNNCFYLAQRQSGKSRRNYSRNLNDSKFVLQLVPPPNT